MVTETFISCELPCVGINTKLNAKLALRQRADLFEANISNIENVSLKSISPLPYCQPCIQCVIIPTQSSEIRQERTSRFYLRVEWTSAFKGF